MSGRLQGVPASGKPIPHPGISPAETVPVSRPGESVPVLAGDLAGGQVSRIQTPGRVVIGKWVISQVGGRWAAIQPYVDPMHLLRYFDTYGEAVRFAQGVADREAIVR
jgi:hypothetical protein